MDPPEPEDKGDMSVGKVDFTYQPEKHSKEESGKCHCGRKQIRLDLKGGGIMRKGTERVRKYRKAHDHHKEGRKQ